MPTPGLTCSALVDTMLTMEPPPASTIIRPKAWQHSSVPITLTSRTARASSSEVSSNGENRQTPALLTSTSTRPTRAARAATPAGSVMSHTSQPGSVPAEGGRRSTPTTSIPSARSRDAIAAPIPCAAPVTRARSAMATL